MFTKAFLLSAIATLVAAQSSVLTFTRVPNPVTDGQPQAITYATNDTTSPVTITLRKGLQTDLQTIETLTTTATGGQFVWTPSLSLPNGVDYALQISQGSQVNYFGPFVVQGASAYPSSSASASGSASASSNATTTIATTVVPVGTNSAGTGTALPRNTTMSMATLSSATSSSPASNTASATTSSGAGFQSATGSASASQSASGASNIQIGSSIALFGAIAAAVFLQ